MLGVTSAGSGSLIALGLILIFRLDAAARGRHRHLPRRRSCCGRRRSPTSSPATSTTPSPGTILIGSVPGVWIGSHMSVRLPAGTLRTVLGVVLVGASMGLASKAGLPIPTGSSPPCR